MQTFLKLFDAEEPDDKPQANWPLSRFVREDFLPNVIEPGDPAQATTAEYWQLVEKCRQSFSNSDPPIGDFCRNRRGDDLATELRAWLAGANHRRGLGQFRPIGERRQRGYMDRFFLVLRRALELKLIAELPKIARVHVKYKEPNLPYLMADARAIYRATSLMGDWPPERKRRVNPPRGWLPPCPFYWRALVSMWYWSGFRSDDALDLPWESILPDDGQRPVRIVWEAAKTGNPLVSPMHPDLIAVVDAIRPAPCDPKALIFPRAYDRRMLAKEYDRLTELAGLAEPRRQSPQAWRRTHAAQIGATGVHCQLELARLSLGHSSAVTTQKHYFDTMVKSMRLMERLEQGEPASGVG